MPLSFFFSLFYSVFSNYVVTFLSSYFCDVYRVHTCKTEVFVHIFLWYTYLFLFIFGFNYITIFSIALFSVLCLMFFFLCVCLIFFYILFIVSLYLFYFLFISLNFFHYISIFSFPFLFSLRRSLPCFGVRFSPLSFTNYLISFQFITSISLHFRLAVISVFISIPTFRLSLNNVFRVNTIKSKISEGVIGKQGW